jgi:hypothetical protein
MAFDRTKAIDYAKKHWDRTCDDGYFWLTGEPIYIAKKRTELKAPAADGWEDRFVYDGAGGEEAVFIKPKAGGVTIPHLAGTWEKKVIQPWEGLADCAHYLSKCLEAGGVKVAEIAVSKLVNTLQGRSDTKTLAEKVPQAAAQRVVDSGVFKEGDMIGYFNINPSGDFGRVNSYTHSTMFVGKDGSGKGRITCHTKSRFMDKYYGDEWFLHSGDYKYTMIHIADEPAIPAATIANIEGWWQIGTGGLAEFFKFSKNGTFAVSVKAPKKASDGVALAIDSGYWFDRLVGITAFGRKRGTVVDLVPSMLLFGPIVHVNGARSTATRVF